MAVLMHTCLVSTYLVLGFKMGGGALVSISFITGASMVGVFCCCAMAGVTCCSTLRGAAICWVADCCCVAVSGIAVVSGAVVMIVIGFTGVLLL